MKDIDQSASKYLVYEMHKGRCVGVHFNMQSALDQAHRSCADVPDEAGMLVATCRQHARHPTQIDSGDDLVAQGFGLVWRALP